LGNITIECNIGKYKLVIANLNLNFVTFRH
jgi:hypothetical protein